MRVLIIAAALCGLLLVVLGATTGHNSAPPPGDPDLYISSWMQDTERQALLNTILLFGFAHILAAIGAIALRLRGLLATASGWSFLACNLRVARAAVAEVAGDREAHPPVLVEKVGLQLIGVQHGSLPFSSRSARLWGVRGAKTLPEGNRHPLPKDGGASRVLRRRPRAPEDSEEAWDSLSW